jgi:hypothetical protein
MYSSINLN